MIPCTPVISGLALSPYTAPPIVKPSSLPADSLRSGQGAQFPKYTQSTKHGTSPMILKNPSQLQSPGQVQPGAGQLQFPKKTQSTNGGTSPMMLGNPS